MPVYNAKNTIKRAIHSVLKQTVNSLELIIIDDCSNDGTSNLIRKMSKIYQQIMILNNNKNIGPGPSRNKGIEIATGEYIAFLDADDIYPNKQSLEEMYKASIKNKVKICGSLREEQKGFRTFTHPLYRKECINNPNGLIMNYRDTQVDFDYTNYIFDRNFIRDNRIKFPDLRRYQDVPFFVSAMIDASTYYVVPIVGYRYTIRKHPLNFSEQMLIDLLKGILTILELSNRNNLEILKNRTLDRLSTLFFKQLIQANDSNNEKIHICLGYLINNYFQDHTLNNIEIRYPTFFDYNCDLDTLFVYLNTD